MTAPTGPTRDEFDALTARVGSIETHLGLNPPTPPPAPSSYTVVAGDTLSGIAARFGVTVAYLAARNSIADPSRIRVGQVLALTGAVPDPEPEPDPEPDPAPDPEPTPDPTPAPPATLDDGNVAIQYSAGWQASAGATKFGGADRYTSTAGATATVRFAGTRARLFGAKASHHGRATVAVDGRQAEVVTQTAATRTENTEFFDTGPLPAGEHTLTLTVTGDGVIALDRVELNGAPTPAPDPAPTPDPGPAPQPGAMPAITVSGNRLLRGGVPWWFCGYNSFTWSANCGTSSEKMSVAEVEAWFASMRHDGHGAARLFFYRGWDLARLDAAIASARRHNIYLLITLDDAIAGCGANSKNSGWFGDAGQRGSYRAHLEAMVGRYKGETAILAFEYFNEPGGGGTAGALRSFYDEMGAAAKAIDPNRLFSSGTVAPYWLGGEAQFRAVSESPGVHIVSLHEYDEGEVESNHGPKVRANSAGKPVIVGEFGIKATSPSSSRAARFAAKLAAYTPARGYAGAFAWAWCKRPANSVAWENLDTDTEVQKVLRAATP